MKYKIAADSTLNILKLEGIEYSSDPPKVLTERSVVLVGFEDSLNSEEESI